MSSPARCPGKYDFEPSTMESTKLLSRTSWLHRRPRLLKTNTSLVSIVWNYWSREFFPAKRVRQRDQTHLLQLHLSAITSANSILSISSCHSMQNHLQAPMPCENTYRYNCCNYSTRITHNVPNFQRPSVLSTRYKI